MQQRILFIAPKFFDYYKLIIDNLKYRGYIVDYFPDIPGPFFRYFYRGKATSKYYCKKILPFVLRNNYEYIFVIKGDSIPINFLTILRKRFYKAKFINYLWDDLKRSPGSFERHKFYDKVITYSRLDSIEYNLPFYPIFFNMDNTSVSKLKKYDLSFIGTWHSNRLEFVNSLKNKFPSSNFFIHLYCPIGGLKFIKGIKGVISGSLKLYKIGYKDLLNICSESRIVLDFAIKDQNAPTTRIIEAMVVQTKIITTCKDIVNYDYYDQENILVIDPDNVDIPIEWISAQFKEISPSIIEKYELNTWINNILFQ